MLEQDIKTQLLQHFAGCRPTQLLVVASSHPQQQELLQFLQDIVEVHPALQIVQSPPGEQTPEFGFALKVDAADTGLFFRAIPSGHEFTTFVLALLNASGKGKLPDPALLTRIRSLRGPIAIRSYISLSCEVCPDVMQALQILALAHPEFCHEMVDGGLFPAEVEALGIQGVPAVFAQGKLLHSGKTNLLELLQKLEQLFGTETTTAATTKSELQDVAIIGGGPAGVTAAIYCARKGLKTTVLCERIGGQVQDTKGIENLVAVGYIEGPHLSAHLAQRLQEQGVQVLEHRRVEKITTEEVKTLHLSGGEQLKAKSVILATGAKWRELGVTGEKEYLGRGVAFCPHCDGPYFKGRDVVVVGGGNSGVEAAIDLAGICRNVILLEFAAQLKADEVLVQRMQTLPNVRAITSAQTLEVVGDGSKVTGLIYLERATQQRQELPIAGVFVQIGLLPNSGFVAETVTVNRFGEIEIDAKGRTSVAGIYAAGDVTTSPYKQILTSMGEGAVAALTAFQDLTLR